MAPTRRARRAHTEENLGCDYSRFSTEYQSSIPEQQGTNRDIADERAIRIVKSFTDKGVSRSVKDRPGLLAMKAHLEAHPEIGFIIVPELERLTAGVEQRAEVKRMCQRLRVTIVTEVKMIDPFDDDAMHEADQNAVASEGEVLKVRRRTVRSLKQKVLAGTVTMRPAYGVRSKAALGPDGKPLPAGVKMVDDRGRAVRSGVIELHPDEEPWLRQIFEWAAAGKSPLQIGRALEEAGVPTKTGQADWANRTIEGIVANAFYKGDMTWGKRKTVRVGDDKYVEERDADDPNRVVVKSPLGAIIDPELWARANIGIKQRSDGRRDRARRTFPSQVFDGFVYCGRCGHRMYGRSDGNLAYGTPGRTFAWRYCCLSATRENLASKCPKAWTLSEKKILAALATLGSDQAIVTVRSSEAAKAEFDARVAKQAADELKEKRERQGHLYEDGIITRAELRRRRDELDAELATLEPTKAAAKKDKPVAAYLVTSGGWAELVELLADKSIPVTDRVAALRTAGVSRLYLNGPLVEVELVDGDPGVEGRLLRLEHRDSLVDS